MKPLQFSVNIGRQEPMCLQRAILIYGRRHEQTFATVHDVAMVNNKPTILAGRAMTSAMSRRLTEKLGSQKLLGSYLPANVLAVDGDWLMWYEPPQMRHAGFKQSDLYPKRSLGRRGGKAPMPGVVFVASRYRWYVYGFKGNERPAPDTLLFQAPFYNVDQSGQICAGNVEIPKSTTAERIAAWNDAFFRSYFAHANYDGVVNYKGDVTALWRDLLDGQFGAELPEEAMKPDPFPLDTLIRRMGSD